MLNVQTTGEKIFLICYAVFATCALLYLALLDVHYYERLPERWLTLLDLVYVRGKEKRRKHREERRLRAEMRRKQREESERQFHEWLRQRREQEQQNNVSEQ